MKESVTFLGTGTSMGVPVIGCQCEVCMSTDRHDKRLRTSAIVSTQGLNLLIDCGPDFRQQMLDNGSPAIDALLLTHHHYDHISGIDDLRPYCNRESGFDIYASESICSLIRREFNYCFGPDRYPGSPKFNLHTIYPYQPFTVCSKVTVMPLTVLHRPDMPIMAFRIGDISYITDCKIMPQKTLDALVGTKLLIINSLRHKEHPSHMNLNEALHVIDKVRPEKAFLTHMLHDIGLHKQLSANMSPGIRPAYDGLKIEL